jgi:hypothetical protein
MVLCGELELPGLAGTVCWWGGYMVDVGDYQYTVAKKYNLSLVSFDRDFDQTTRGRKRPGDFLNL